MSVFMIVDDTADAYLSNLYFGQLFLDWLLYQFFTFQLLIISHSGLHHSLGLFVILNQNWINLIVLNSMQILGVWFLLEYVHAVGLEQNATLETTLFIGPVVTLLEAYDGVWI